jgi:hypothetical protein
MQLKHRFTGPLILERPYFLPASPNSRFLTHQKAAGFGMTRLASLGDDATIKLRSGCSRTLLASASVINSALSREKNLIGLFSFRRGDIS